VALLQGLIRVEWLGWPTNRKLLVAPELKKERIAEKIASTKRPFSTPEHRPLYMPARTKLPQQIQGMAPKGAYAIL
jgi:hypothetical protein